jgi:hypothetical protein
MLKTSEKSSLQLDDSTDVTYCSLLLVEVRLLILLVRLLSEELPSRSTEEEIFLVFRKFVCECCLGWFNCVSPWREQQQ